jgi:hypothetical protein
VEGCREHGNEPSGSIKHWELSEQMAASREGLNLMKLVS